MIHYIGQLGALDRNVVRAHVEQNFSARVMVEKYTRAYRQVIRSSVIKSSNTLVSLSVVRKVPSTASTPVVLPSPSPFAPSQKSSKLKALPMSSPFVRSESPAEPDVASLP